MAEVGNLLGKITYLMVVIIRGIGLMAGCFCFLSEFIGFLFFLGCLFRILDGFI